MCAVFFSASALCRPVLAQTTNAMEAVGFLKEMAGAFARAQSVASEFVQERHLSLFEEPLRSSGWLCFQRPGRIRWETTLPYQSILVCDGAGVAQFEWLNHRWQKLDLGLKEALRQSLAEISLMMEGRYLDRQQAYEFSINRGKDEIVLTLTPKVEGARRLIAAIEVHLPPDLQGTRQVVLREPNGDFTSIRFTKQTMNAALPPESFSLTAPVALEAIQRALRDGKP